MMCALVTGGNGSVSMAFESEASTTSSSITAGILAKAFNSEKPERDV